MSHSPVRPRTAPLNTENLLATVAPRVSSPQKPRPGVPEKPGLPTDQASGSSTWYDHLRLAAYFPNDPDTLESD
jgi:hypothetical protein